jgi:diguanylate cyclase (GGDEF)-like protein
MVEDYRVLADRRARFLASVDYRTGVAAPVRVGAHLWGTVAVATTRADGLPEGAKERLAQFAELVALAIASADARARLASQAATDPLTGLPNRRVFDERLHDEVARARRHSRSLAVCVLDLDHFKAVNDTLGHVAGDHVLIEVSRRLSAEARTGELIARMGGDEFAWLLPETDRRGAAAAAERARRSVAEPPVLAGRRLTLSAGVSDLRRGAGGEALVRLADAALYRAKAGGRDMVSASD